MIEIRKLNDHTMSITRIWFKWYLDETLDLDLWADDIGEGLGASGRVIGGGMLSTPDNAVVWMCVCSQNPYLEILTCKVMVLESGAFGRVTLTIINGIIALVKRGLREIPCPFSQVKTQGKDDCLGTESGTSQTKSRPASWSRTSQPSELWEINVCYLLATHFIIFWW